MYEKAAKILSEPIEEMYVLGIIDKDESHVFSPALEVLYIETASSLLKLEAIEQCSRLLITFPVKIENILPFEIESGMSVCSAPLGDLLLPMTTMGDTRVSKMDFFGAGKDNAGGSISCMALRLTFKSGDLMFFDPTYLFGIKTGGEKLSKTWAANLSKALPQPITRHTNV